MFRCGIVCFILFSISNVWCSEQKGQMIFSFQDLTAMQRSPKIALSESLQVTNDLELRNFYFNYNDDGSLDYYSASIYNNSYAGAYNFELYIDWRDKNNYRLSFEDQGIDYSGVIGNHAQIYTHLYKDSDSAAFRIDYIPPLGEGYILVNSIWADMPDSASVDHSVFYLDWLWTLRANTSNANIVTINADYTNGRFSDELTFTVRNNWNKLLTEVELYAVLFNQEKQIIHIESNSLGENIVPNSDVNKSFSIYADIPTPDSIATRILYDFENGERIGASDLDGFDPAYIFPDTVFSLNMPDSTRQIISALKSRISVLKSGDLNEDGTVDLADFLLFSDLFSENFGTSSSQ